MKTLILETEEPNMVDIYVRRGHGYKKPIGTYTNNVLLLHAQCDGVNVTIDADIIKQVFMFLPAKKMFVRYYLPDGVLKEKQVDLTILKLKLPKHQNNLTPVTL